jgi:hypothetical protein
MGAVKAAWLYVTDAATFEAARAEGLPAAGLPARDPEEAARAGRGDLIAVYVADAEAFAAAAEAAEAVPGPRIALEQIALCPAGDLEPAAPLAPHLVLGKELSLSDWGALPRGALRPLPVHDAEQVLFSCRARARGRPRPPGVPPTEAEKPPPIPKKLRRRE